MLMRRWRCCSWEVTGLSNECFDENVPVKKPPRPLLMGVAARLSLSLHSSRNAQSALGCVAGRAPQGHSARKCGRVIWYCLFQHGGVLGSSLGRRRPLAALARAAAAAAVAGACLAEPPSRPRAASSTPGGARAAACTVGAPKRAVSNFCTGRHFLGGAAAGRRRRPEIKTCALMLSLCCSL